MKFLVLFLSLLATACQTGSKPQSAGVSYADLLRRYTRSHEQYEGVYNVFQVRATLLNSPVRHAVWQKQNTQFNWSPEVADTKREQSVDAMRNSTQFMLSFYTPDVSLNYLDKAQSVWKLQLRVGGQVYKGAAAREFVSLVDQQELFLHPTAWHKIYKVSFEVPTEEVERLGAHLIVRGLKATKELEFPATPVGDDVL